MNRNTGWCSLQNISLYFFYSKNKIHINRIMITPFKTGIQNQCIFYSHIYQIPENHLLFTTKSDSL